MDFQYAFKKLTRFPKSPSRIVAFDFETTGVHLHHHDRPFMLCATFMDGESLKWEGQVDPFTRRVYWSKEDQYSISQFFQHDDWLYYASNAKFDVLCASIVCDVDGVELLTRCHDTIMMHHSFNNNEPHDLKGAAVKYCRMLDADETALHRSAMKARVIAQRMGWAIATKTTCPQQKKAPDKGWPVMDMWLPKALAEHNWKNSEACRILGNLLDWPEAEKKSSAYTARLEIAKRASGWEWAPPSLNPNAHPDWTLCANYCTLDTVRSLLLGKAFEQALSSQKTYAVIPGVNNLYDCYLKNRTALPISYNTEQFGVTINTTVAPKIQQELLARRERAKEVMFQCFNNKILVKPNSSLILRRIIYEIFGIPVSRLTDTGKPTTDADFISEWCRLCREQLEDPDSHYPPVFQEGVESRKDYERRINDWYKALIADGDPSTAQVYVFLSALLVYKKAMTSINYLKNYQHSCLPLNKKTKSTLDGDNFGVLYPSLNPIGTKTTRYSSSNPNGQNVSKGGKGKKGREWLKTQSLRVVFGPASGREWWSFDYHQIQLAIFAVCCGDERMIEAVKNGLDFHTFVAQAFFELPPEVKPESWQRDVAKTINFAFIFGAQEEKLNRSSGIEGCYLKLKKVFPKAVTFLEETEKHVYKYGYVTTRGGNRLYVPSKMPYAGPCYIVQGTEGEIVKEAQTGIQVYLDENVYPADKMYMTLYIHDDLLFDAELGYGRQHVKAISSIMDRAAELYGIPSKSECKYITENWGEGTVLDLEELEDG